MRAYGYDTWPPDAWKNTGGANTWVNFSIDQKRGIGYFPTGSPTTCEPLACRKVEHVEGAEMFS